MSCDVMSCRILCNRLSSRALCSRSICRVHTLLIRIGEWFPLAFTNRCLCLCLYPCSLCPLLCPLPTLTL
jgi:hypothetical protein